jgi:ATP-dependent exoDNAse (exonuclease V) beta subunit
VHALLEWSQGNGWREPSVELARRHALAAGLDPERTGTESLLAPLREWLGSPLREQIEAEATRVRAEVPILLGLGGTVLRGSIDLLVERGEAPPLVIDYKTDRLAGADPAERAGRYETQRAIYALATAESLGAPEVEVAYVFLERPAEPVLSTLERMQMTAARQHLETTIHRIESGDFPVTAEPRRSWDLCRGCPALGNLCSGPADEAAQAA